MLVIQYGVVMFTPALQGTDRSRINNFLEIWKIRWIFPDACDIIKISVAKDVAVFCQKAVFYAGNYH